MKYRQSFYTAAAALLAGAVAMLTPATSAAHGAFPLSEAVTGVSTAQNGNGGGDSKDGWVLKANFGLLTSQDGDRYICEESFSGGARFDVAVLGVHEWVIFSEDRIVRTDDACSFSEVKSLSRNVSDYAHDAEAGKVAYVTTGQSGSELWVSDDRGKSFSELALELSKTQITQIEFVSGGRIFASAYINESGAEHPTGTAVLLVISDGGIESRTVVKDYNYPYVQAARGDQVAWLAGTPGGQVMIWGTVDQPDGATHGIKSWPTGAAFDASGTSLWVAGVGADGGSGGFLHATRSNNEAPSGDSVSFEEVQKMHSAGCVGFAGGDVHACARRDTEGADLQRLADGTFEGVVNFNDLKGPRQDCPADSDVGSTCPAVWPELEKALKVSSGGDAGSDIGSDAGSSDTGTDADAGEADAGASADADSGSENDAGSGSDGGSGATGGTTGGTSSGTGGGSGDGGCSATGSAGAANPILVLLSMLTAMIVGLVRREEQETDDV